ncbi:MAG TPA: alpha/beta hydrolase [Mycobacterium sp.]|nr:alpha/beta hydrolase [Mycobacterium sp.]
MGEFLVRLLDEWGIDQPHLVCPDIGTSAALFAAAHHPGRMRSLVVGSGASAYPLVVGRVLKELIEAPSLDPFRSRNPREVVAAAIAAMGSAAPAADVVEDYIESNRGDRFVQAIRYVRSYPDQLQRVGQLLSTIFTPVQIIAGRWDPWCPWPTPTISRPACPTAASTCSTPAISPGNRHLRTMPRSSPPGSIAAISPEAQDSSMSRNPPPTHLHTTPAAGLGGP